MARQTKAQIEEAARIERAAHKADMAASCAYWTGCALQHDADYAAATTDADRGWAASRAKQARELAAAQAQRWWDA